MNRDLAQTHDLSLLDDAKTFKKIDFNYRKNKEQDNTEVMDALAKQFSYEDCAGSYWNPEHFSLLYGTPLWEQSSEAQRVKLNQIYWVAYYSQIISAEIATIFFNQTCAASLYGIEDFRVVCDTLDLESMQERAHINAFKVISEEFERKVFGARVFSYPMRGPYVETMVYKDGNRVTRAFRNLQLKLFTVISATNAFVGCQYFTVRGIRTLNGKIVQHQLGQHYTKMLDREAAPIPSKISYYHFLDESFHFNSSTIISQDVINSIKPPNAYEAWIANQGIRGTQRDHFNVSSAINGLFWFDPALYPKVYQILRSPVFGMGDRDARDMMVRCFTKENEGVHGSFKNREVAMQSYREYVSRLDYVARDNRDMAIMARNSIANHLERNKEGLRTFFRRANQLPILSVPIAFPEAAGT